MSESSLHRAATFPVTRWSVVLASRSDEPECRRALDELCEAYWYPLYAYLRRTGTNDVDARDQVQDFVVGILEGGALDGADPERGSFRGYMMGAIQHHASNARRDASALKRGGGNVTSLDLWDPSHAAAERYGRSTTVRSADEEFERAWALELVARATERLRSEYQARGRGALYEALEGTLDGSAGDRTHEQRAEALKCTVGAVKVNAHRMRQRLRDLLREEVAQTVGDSSDVDAELGSLVRVLGGSTGASTPA